MKIVISAWHLRNPTVGLGRYTYNLIESLGKVDKVNEYEILIPGRIPTFTPRPNIQYRSFFIPVFKRRLWEQICPLLVGKYDLLHFPYDSCVGTKRGKFVVTLHDAKSQLFPKPYKISDLKYYIKKMFLPNPSQHIDHVITVSEHSRKDLMKEMEIAEKNITVIYQGVEHEKFCPPNQRGFRPLQEKSYILCVAGDDPTKNVKVLIQAFSLLPLRLRREYRLVLVGDVEGRSDLTRLVQQFGIEQETIFTGVVSDEQLIPWYQYASIFVFPSLYEGFGLPVLEAMACGCPVISSNRSSLPEVVGQAGIMVDPMNINEIVRAMEQVLSNPEMAKHMGRVGLSQASRFSWDKTARATVGVYEKVVNRI